MNNPAFNTADWAFVMSLRRARIVVTCDGRLEIQYDESSEYAAKRLRDYVIKEADVVEESSIR